MKTATEARAILRALERLHPNADTELRYSNAFELLVATILSAQTTDAGVNAVTPTLFARYPDARAMARANVREIEALVRTTGFFRQKARALLGMAHGLVERHGGQVPADMDALVGLPGVGRKTANVVLGHALGIPGLPVDRHVLRVTNRIGLAQSDEPETVERQLCGLLPRAKWTVASDSFILHGRRICKPKPLCDRCPLDADCAWFQSGVAGAAVPSKAARPARAPRPRARRA